MCIYLYFIYLTKKEIWKISQFDYNDSVDEKNEEKEQNKILVANFENVLKETLNNIIDKGKSIETTMIEKSNRQRKRRRNNWKLIYCTVSGRENDLQMRWKN